MMGNMKGAFMKLGQILSFAAEVVPENARNALAKLQMEAPPMSFAIARRVVEEDLGGISASTSRASTRSRSRPPRSARCTARRCPTEHDVAVKVQYPGVGAAIDSDLKASRGLAAMLSTMNRNIDAQGVVDEVRERLFEELDYTQASCAISSSSTGCGRAPLDPRPARVSRAVGRARASHRSIAAACVQRLPRGGQRAGEARGVYAINDFVFDSMFRHCVFNADPHPGNYLLQEDGGVAFLDFGCVKYFRPEFIANLQALNRALIENDSVELRAAAQEDGGRAARQAVRPERALGPSSATTPRRSARTGFHVHEGLGARGVLGDGPDQADAHQPAEGFRVPEPDHVRPELDHAEARRRRRTSTRMHRRYDYPESRSSPASPPRHRAPPALHARRPSSR